MENPKRKLYKFDKLYNWERDWAKDQVTLEAALQQHGEDAMIILSPASSHAELWAWEHDVTHFPLQNWTLFGWALDSLESRIIKRYHIEEVVVFKSIREKVNS